MGLFDFFKKKRAISPKTQLMIDRIKERSNNTELIKEGNATGTLSRKQAKTKATELLQSGKLNEAITFYTGFKRNNHYKGKGSGFFLEFSENDLRAMFDKIRKTKVFDEIGLPAEHINKFREVFYELYLFGDVDLQKRFDNIFPGSSAIVKKSSRIKNKDVPFLDLKNLIKGDKIVKINYK